MCVITVEYASCQLRADSPCKEPYSHPDQRREGARGRLNLNTCSFNFYKFVRFLDALASQVVDMSVGHSYFQLLIILPYYFILKYN